MPCPKRQPILYSRVEGLIPPVRDLSSLVRLPIGVLVILGRWALLVGRFARSATGSRMVAGTGERRRWRGSMRGRCLRGCRTGRVLTSSRVSHCGPSRLHQHNTSCKRLASDSRGRMVGQWTKRQRTFMRKLCELRLNMRSCSLMAAFRRAALPAPAPPDVEAVDPLM